MSENKRDYILCEHCKAVVRATHFAKHLRRAHGVRIKKNLDLALRAKNDARLIQTRRKKINSNSKLSLEEIHNLRLKNEAERERKRSEEIKKRRAEKERLRAERGEDINKNKKHFYIIWDDISFEKDRIRFSPTRIGTLLHSVELKGVIPDLNTIKDEYFKRLHPKEVYKLYFYHSNLLQEESPHWEKIISTIEVGKQYFEFKAEKSNKVGPEFTIEEIMKLNVTSFNRSPYLQYLATIHHENFKIIPIIEVRCGAEEESFIFRTMDKKNPILIIWENTNDSRATHIFRSNNDNHTMLLKNIEWFICTDMRAKRSLLYLTDGQSKQMKKELGYITNLRHQSLTEYKREIKRLIRTVWLFTQYRIKNLKLSFQQV